MSGDGPCSGQRRGRVWLEIDRLRQLPAPARASLYETPTKMCDALQIPLGQTTGMRGASPMAVEARCPHRAAKALLTKPGPRVFPDARHRIAHPFGYVCAREGLRNAGRRTPRQPSGNLIGGTTTRKPLGEHEALRDAKELGALAEADSRPREHGIASLTRKGQRAAANVLTGLRRSSRPSRAASHRR